MDGGWMKKGASIPNLINICVDRSTQGEIGGRIYHFYDKRPQNFDNVVQLLRQMENFYNALHFPEASVRLRKFVRTEHAGDEKKLQEELGREEVLARRGQCATFYVYVQYRQNATWQGTLIWKEREQEEEFRSALELIILLDNALSEI